MQQGEALPVCRTSPYSHFAEQMIQNLSTFIRHGCTKGELATAYIPSAPPQNARRTLARWIRRHPTLPAQLSEAGYNAHQHHVTPRQVQLILEALGEP